MFSGWAEPGQWTVTLVLRLVMGWWPQDFQTRWAVASGAPCHWALGWAGPARCSFHSEGWGSCACIPALLGFPVSGTEESQRKTAAPLGGQWRAVSPLPLEGAIAVSERIWLDPATAVSPGVSVAVWCPASLWHGGACRGQVRQLHRCTGPACQVASVLPGEHAFLCLSWESGAQPDLPQGGRG